MRMLGEMAVASPDTGSFATYARSSIGRWAGFTIGWLYWLFWTLLMDWEAYVAGQILHSWFLVFPGWMFSLLITCALVSLNFMQVRNYGEFEFWFALIKVLAIVIFIIIGTLTILNLWPWGNASGINHLTANGGFMPNGIKSVIVALLGAMFAFLGAEIVTVAASESDNLAKEIIKTTKSVVWRICLFYVGSIFIVVCLVPYHDPQLTQATHGSYNVTLTALGIPYTNYIVNFIVLTSVCSCFNSAFYTASRMLYSMAKRNDAPVIFTHTGKTTGTPYFAVIASSLFAFLAIFLTMTAEIELYNTLMQATGTIALYVYLVIAYSQLKMRKKLDAAGVKLDLKMWCFPWLTYLVLVFIISLIVMVIEGTYWNEVVYTSLLTLGIMFIGFSRQKSLEHQDEELQHAKIQRNNQSSFEPQIAYPYCLWIKQ